MPQTQGTIWYSLTSRQNGTLHFSVSKKFRSSGCTVLPNREKKNKRLCSDSLVVG